MAEATGSIKLPVQGRDGAQQSEQEVDFEVIRSRKGTHAVHEAVVAYQAAQRSGTASTKTRSEVSASGKKPWRQKGTGRARAGSFASPIWRGGGIVFGPKPRDYRKKLSKRTRRLALRKAMSERLLAGEVVLVDELGMERPRTKEAGRLLDQLGVNDGTLLIVVNEKDENLVLSMRNIPHVEVTTADSVNTYDVLWPDRLLMTQGAFQTMAQRLKERG